MKRLLFILFIVPVLCQAQYVKKANSVYNELTVFPNITVANTLINVNGATSLLPNADTVRANSLTVGGHYHFDLLSQLTVPTISIPTLTIRVIFGGNTIVLGNGLSLVGSGSAVPFRIVGDIWVKSATQAVINAHIEQSTSTVINTPIGSMTPLSIVTVNMAQDNLFNITSQFGGITLGTTSLVPQVFDREIYQ